MTTPNLDAMTVDELQVFASAHRGMAPGRKMFPEGGKGTNIAARDLVAYAWNKSTAMQCRLRGDISTAWRYEGICDRIFDRLPEFARW